MNAPDADLERMPDEHPHVRHAKALAVRRALLFGLLPSTFERLITDVTFTPEHYSRALHRIERRIIASQIAPAFGSSARDLGALAPEPRDPWRVDPERLPEESRRVVTCGPCRGLTKVNCGTCSGTERVRCRECRGSGRVMGAKRMKNCPTCRAKGDVRCGLCRGGKVDCRTCNAIGRVVHRFVVERTTRVAVVVRGGGLAMRAHTCVGEPADFDTPARWRNTRTEDLAVEPDRVDASLRVPLDSATERVLETRVQSFAGQVAYVHYETALGRGCVVLPRRRRSSATARRSSSGLRSKRSSTLPAFGSR